jgi:hypothetical protein
VDRNVSESVTGEITVAFLMHEWFSKQIGEERQKPLAWKYNCLKEAQMQPKPPRRLRS